jgi:hypothetical protein
MANPEKERRILEAKIAGVEARLADLRKPGAPHGADAAQKTSLLDLELLTLRADLKKLSKGRQG